jgi:hypothetical protein
MNTYIAFFKGQRIEIEAESQYQAQQKAAQRFKARKSYEVTTILAQIDGKTVTHSTASI